MEITIQGDQSAQEAMECLAGIIALFHERYGVDYFREICLNVALIDEKGSKIELIDPDTSEAYEFIEVVQSESTSARVAKPDLKLVVDNT